MNKKKKLLWPVAILGLFLLLLSFLLPEEKTTEAETVTTVVETYENDFYSEYRMTRSAQRSEEKEALEAVIKDEMSSSETREAARLQLWQLLEQSRMENNVEVILKGRNYEDAVFILDETLSMLIIKKEVIDDEEIKELSEFVSSYAGLGEAPLTVFTVK